MPCALTRSVASFANPDMQLTRTTGALAGPRRRSFARMGGGADQAIKACGGDARAAVIALLILNDAIEHELELTRIAVSSALRAAGITASRQAPKMTAVHKRANAKRAAIDRECRIN